MFHRIRQLRISLAAKCQILFGAAVVLIIASALAVPWQRMEQLTEQLNVRTASALADNAIAEHIALHSAGLPDVPVPGVHRAYRPVPADRAPAPSSQAATSQPATGGPATNPAANPPLPPTDPGFPGPPGGSPPAPPHLVSLAPRRATSNEAKFERRAIGHFARNPDSNYYAAYYDRPDSSKGYRYAQPLYLNPETCLGCHTTAAQAQPHLQPTRPTTQPISAEAAMESSMGYSTPQPTTQAGSDAVAQAGLATTAPGERASAPATLPAASVVTNPTNPATAPDPNSAPDSAGNPVPNSVAKLPGGLARPVVLLIDPNAKNVGWVGIVSVEFASRIDTTQRLLNRAFILMAGLLAGVLAFFTFYFITTRLILQPVRVLQETAEKVSEGDLNIRSDISTGDEFQQLAETFNVMLANLKENADALRAVNKSLDLRLGQLAETNVGLYESNRLKSEFLANVSHELRTPLNSILGFADLLKDALAAGPAPDARENAKEGAKDGVRDGARDGAKDGRDAKAIRYVNNIRQSGRNLLDLINDLLDLAKIEAGRMEIRSEPLSLSDLFEGLTTILKPLVEPKRVVIEPSVAPDVPILHSDPGKLQQVLYNLLSNAIKFSPEEGVITVTAERVDAPPDSPGTNGAANGAANGSGSGNGSTSTRDAQSRPRGPSAPNGSPAASTPTPASPTAAATAAPDANGAAEPVGYVRVAIADQGPGIDPAKHAVIFEKFRQLDGSVTRAHSGTGLGLAISKELTTLLGGRIGVDSSPGEGATFWLVLPLDLPAGQVDVRSRMALV